MTIGPVEYILVEFPENRFTGEIVPALAELIASRIVRLIDAVFITKDEAGIVLYEEYDAAEIGDGFGLAGLEGEVGLFNEEDIVIAAASLAPNSSALLLVWEDLWAAPLAGAIRRAGGQLLDGGRIPHSLVVAALEHD